MKRERVVWTKGMFLNPQHFQTQDQYFEDSVHFRFAASNYCNWGVTALEIDVEALANGLFRLSEARGIMPDGQWFKMPENDDLPPSRALGDLFGTSDKQLDVYLTIPEHRVDAVNVTMRAGPSSSAPADTRYIAETRMIADVNTGMEEKPVQVARKNFGLLFGPENRDGMSELKIAQIVRNPAGVCILKPTYIAPCLDIAHNKYVIGLLQRLVEVLSTKSDSLSATRRERGKGLADFTASETANFWLLHTANSSLPELRHILKVRHGHPEQAYLAMARLAGSLATFALDFSPNDLPDYDHGNLGACFAVLDDQIRLLIDTVIKEGYIAVPFIRGERDIWTATVPDDRYFRDAEFYLAISAAMDVGEIIQKIPIRVKAATVDDIDRLIRNAVSGISLTHTSAPGSVRMKLGNQYFALSQMGDMWQKVKQSRSIAVFTPSDIREPKLELIIVTGQGK